MAYGDRERGIPDEIDKGEEGGACNRQLCQARPANWYNHGSGKWYCGDCKHDIGEDWVNRRNWNLRHRPALGHDMFETREMMDARLVCEAKAEAQDRQQRVPELDVSMFEFQKRVPYDRYGRGLCRGEWGTHPACRPKEKSESLKRMLRRRK